MSYYNTQTNPQQNPQYQQQQQSQFGQQAQQQGGQFANWMRSGQRRNTQPQQQTQTQNPQQQQQPQQAQGWQPTSAVNGNGTINKTPLTFAAPPKPTPIASTQQAKAGGAPTDLNSAHAAIQNAYMQAYGRQPNQKEIDEWGAALLYGGQTPEMMQANLAGQPGAAQTFNPMAVPGNVNYDAMNYAQYQPQFNPYANDIQGVWNNLLQQPMGLPVEQMKAQQADVANELYKQNAGSMLQDAAAAGRIGGGNAARMQQLANTDRSQQIMGAYRDIDIQDALAQRENAMAMSELGNMLANNQQARAVTDYTTGLQGQQLQDASNQFQAGFNADVWNNLNNNYQQNRAQNLQDFVAQSGMNLDWQRFGQDQSQDRFNNIYDIMNFLEGQRQFNAGNSLDRSRLDLSKNNAALQAALQGRGQDIDLLSFFMGG